MGTVDVHFTRMPTLQRVCTVECHDTHFLIIILRPYRFSHWLSVR